MKKLVVLLSVFVLVGAGCLNKKPTVTDAIANNASDATTKTESKKSDSSSTGATANQAGTGTTTTSSSAPTSSTNSQSTFTGTKLAGTNSPLLEFNQADYDKASASGKLVVLFFYANWCPECKEELPEIKDAFNNLSTDQVVGFRVNFKDTETEDAETELARQFGVPYQHTKVFVRNGERILKAPDSWGQERYLEEILNVLK
ncbi:MAG TPA: thioredoxin family protein [Patescibacteria group bacterium]|nr:thioredoxin family protein [Patescibacteria group bacterium]